MQLLNEEDSGSPRTTNRSESGSTNESSMAEGTPTSTPQKPGCEHCEDSDSKSDFRELTSEADVRLSTKTGDSKADLPTGLPIEKGLWKHHRYA